MKYMSYYKDARSEGVRSFKNDVKSGCSQQCFWYYPTYISKIKLIFLIFAVFVNYIYESDLLPHQKNITKR